MSQSPNTLIPKVMELLLDAVCVVDQEDRFVMLSGACEAVFGYTPEEMTGRSMYDFIHPDDLELTRQAATSVSAGSQHRHFRNRYVRKNGETVHVMWSARRLDDGLRVGVARDVTELTSIESIREAIYAISDAAHADADLPALIRRIHEIVATLLPVGHFVVALKGEGDELSFPYDFEGEGIAARTDEAKALCATIVREHSYSGGSMVRRIERDGVEWLGVPLRSQTGVIGALAIHNRAQAERYTDQHRELLHYVSAQIATAIERKQTQLRLQHLALHDVLTGLPNRALFMDRMNSALTRARRYDKRMALLYIDLNQFKEVNDRYGHATGDALLQEIAQRLRGCMRASDTVSRLGGDEFAVVLDIIAAPDDAALVMNKIHAGLKHPYFLAGWELEVLPSIGIALYPEHGDEPEALMKHADAAMYEEKRKQQ